MLFPEVFKAAESFYDPDAPDVDERVAWLAQRLNRPRIQEFGPQRDMWLVAHIAEAGFQVLRDNDQQGRLRLQGWGWSAIAGYSGRTRDTLEGISRRCLKTAAALTRMERTNRRVAAGAEPLPLDRTALVRYGTVSVVSLAGYTADFQATIYSLIAETIFDARVREDLRLPVLLLLEEAHSFAPANAASAAEQRAISTTRQIAQEGRKFGVGLVLVSQRPSRLDETTLSQCNSYIVMRMVNPADQAFVKRVIETLGEDEARLLPDLDVGEALLSGQLINFPVLVRIKAPASKGEREEQDAFAALEAIQRTLGRSAG
jgi:DNA helicase HerA-like ATPase